MINASVLFWPNMRNRVDCNDTRRPLGEMSEMSRKEVYQSVHTYESKAVVFFFTREKDDKHYYYLLFLTPLRDRKKGSSRGETSENEIRTL